MDYTLRDSSLDPKDTYVTIDGFDENIFETLDGIKSQNLDQKEIAYRSWLMVRKMLSWDVLQEISSRINKWVRFCIVKWLHFSDMIQHGKEALLLWFSQVLWAPTYTDTVWKNIIRKVNPRKRLNLNYKTISEVSWKAWFHTDSQFFPYPEDTFLLACERPANTWWESLLIDWRKLKNNIQQDNFELFQQLCTFKVPFRVPSSFTRSWTDESIEIYQSRIFDQKPLIRYRLDTAERGLWIIKQDNEKIKEMLAWLEKYFTNDRILTHKLEKNDILICNNHELLHARSDFTDSDRLLYRIRLNR